MKILVVLIIFVILGIGSGIVFNAMVLDNTSIIIKWIVGIIVSIIVSCGLFYGYYCDYNYKNKFIKEWNSGKCTKCEMSYKLINIDYDWSKRERIYYFTCDKCGKIYIVNEEKMKLVNKNIKIGG